MAVRNGEAVSARLERVAGGYAVQRMMSAMLDGLGGNSGMAGKP
jgi:hypothetical protein